MCRAPGRPVRACFVRNCSSIIVQKYDLRATPLQCNPKRRFSLPRTPHFTYTSSQFISSKLFSSHFISIYKSTKFFLTIFILSEYNSTFLISLKLVSTYLGSSARQRTTSYDKACPEYFPILFYIIKFAQNTSQYYFVLQSLHEARYTTILKQRSLHKTLPNTTLYCKACTQYNFVV